MMLQRFLLRFLLLHCLLHYSALVAHNRDNDRMESTSDHYLINSPTVKDKNTEEQSMKTLLLSTESFDDSSGRLSGVHPPTIRPPDDEYKSHTTTQDSSSTSSVTISHTSSTTQTSSTTAQLIGRYQ